ncbi:helix-turn-helix DNA binding domain protein [Microbacterium phage Pumpernickel]|uniref:Helix-turn-helix DNA binding domain protein n=1 Tax=Microbacterium phage Pumpernickel TaxID=2885983 RepID=A0AAE8Y9W3_9CAUD|nr:helix-turn-helix DNA binding domain protein [Microbacterium phage Pumpernickel]UDL15867.1 helix-turn-helix DNA binding domain protein [Microbacterium phage Pumpernickel]
MERRAARSQTLPPEEADLLRSLKGVMLYARARELYSEGWTLRSIGEVFTPAKSRSTVRYWITKQLPLASAAPVFPDAPVPTLATPRPLPKTPRRRLTTQEESEIATLAPLARKYRASMNYGHPAAIANKRLTELVVFLHKDERVTIAELASAAGVSYRAMARRIGNA